MALSDYFKYTNPISQISKITDSDFWLGKEGEFKRVSPLRPEQEEAYRNYLDAVKGGQAEAAEYYRKILSDDPEVYQQLFAPEMQQFQQETMPSLAEQYAGLGSGAISSSGFQQTAAKAGADLSERLASMRAKLKGEAAGSLAGLEAGALKPIDYTYYQQDPGFLQQIAPVAGAAAGAAYGGPAGAQMGYQAGQAFGKTSPYGKPQFAGGF
jgi:hypothetical protein